MGTLQHVMKLVKLMELIKFIGKTNEHASNIHFCSWCILHMNRDWVKLDIAQNLEKSERRLQEEEEGGSDAEGECGNNEAYGGVGG